MDLLGRRAVMLGSLAVAAAGSRRSAEANVGWPERPVRFIVPLAAGGGIDLVARQCADVLARSLGQPVIVENRTGAGGTIAMDAILRGDPDGYAILVVNDNVASAPHVLRLPHDYSELLPIAEISRQPLVLGVHPSLGVGTIGEFVAYARAHPGLGFASSGVGSNQHVLGALLAREAGLRLEHVPYRGAGQAVNDLLAGHVKCGMLGPTALLPHHRAGTVGILAQSARTRAKALPDVPTFVDAGFDAVYLDTWYGAFAPPGTPGAIVARLNAAFNEALGDARLKQAFASNLIEPTGGSTTELGQLARRESDRYAKLVSELGIRGG